MKYKLLFTTTFFFTTLLAFSQTKLIHHKSHSGSSESFAISLENNLFDINESNFGVAPTMIVKTAELDSLIYLSDTSTVMVTKEVCRDEYRPKADPRVWKAGRDTIYNHSLFTLKYELDSIKKTLDELYNFQNPVKEMVFIGYTNEQITIDKRQEQLSNKKAKKKLKTLEKQLKKTEKEKQKADRSLKKAKKHLIKSNDRLNEKNFELKEAKERLQKASKSVEENQKEQFLTPLATHSNPPTSPPTIHGISTFFLMGIVIVLSLLTGLIYWKFNQFSKPNLAR